jgi:anti-sigma factor RsiW
MNCREFQEKHVAFVDDTLAGVQLVKMQRHIAECERCAKRDAHIRRALFLAWNLPTIQPSADFSRRLHARLRASIANPLVSKGIQRRVGLAMSLATAAMLGYIVMTLYRVENPRDLLLAPVVASAPESEISPITTPPAAIIASAPAGLAIWPAALIAEEAPVQFARMRHEAAYSTR